LEGKYITRTDERRLERLQGNTLTKLPSTDLAEAFFNAETKLDRSTIGDEQQVGIRVGGAHWGGVDVTAVEWKSIKMLGDEYVARQPCYQDGKAKTKDRRLLEYQRATEANRQLAAVLQSQGLHEEADQFAYRAQKLQREVWRREHRYVKYIGSWFLYLLAGYGYRPLISIIIYLLVVFGFAVGYYQIWATNHLERVTKQTLSSVGAVIFSITAFHGRGFFLGSSGLGYDSLITILGAVEAVIGLIIELSFIATFTRRFLGK
jgi:hypothetical protein